jgi:hypothetical protein
MRRTLNSLRLAETGPLARRGAPTSPRKRGEVRETAY